LERLPLVPRAEIAKFPVAAFAAAPNTTGVLAPEANVNGLAGFDVTPFGSALNVTCTFPVNPFVGLTEIFTAELVPPCCNDTELEERTKEKSGAGGGGGDCVTDEPPPQPLHTHATARKINRGKLPTIRPTARPRVLAQTGGLIVPAPRRIEKEVR